MKLFIKVTCTIIIRLTVYPVTTVLAEDKTSLYAQLLRQYVVDGKVDHIGLKQEDAQLDRDCLLQAITVSNRTFCKRLKTAGVYESALL